ncbi:putative reverse transcriptase domain-containing protein [Tanacetum coccineum]
MADHSKKWHDGSSSRNIKSSSNSEGAHLDKDCPLNEEVKSVEEAKYGEFGGPSLSVMELNTRFRRQYMMKRSLIGIVKNVLVKIDKFLLPSDFVVMDMLNTRNETMLLGRPFIATIHAEIDVFNKEISLGIGGSRYKEVEFEVSLTRFRVVARFCLGVTTLVTP